MPSYSTEHFQRALGFVLRALRRKSGLTQEQAAAEAEMDRPHLGHWEQGRFDPQTYRLARLIGVYDYPFSKAMEWIERRARYYYELERRRPK